LLFIKLINFGIKALLKNDKLYKFQIKAGNFKHWIGIIILIIAGIVYFFKAIE
jgi:hypothetical protein